jgi:catechol 2,3-dioxygenase-like lactoylglutathione lyase family enzyme
VFDHVAIRVSDRAAAEAFYSTVLAQLGVEADHVGAEYTEWDDFTLGPVDASHPLTRRLHIGFAAPSREHVDAFWRAGVEAGYRDDGAPGERPQYTEDYYGAFLLDPDGNSAEAVHHGGVRSDGNVDHVWIRVADLAAARRFYATIAPVAGFRIGTDTPERVSFDGGSGTFSLVPGEATENLHLAFAAPDHATVERFHATAVEAGFASNGGPGERPEYHAGYYAAFVLDPDGNNVELVDHGRG